MGTIRHLLRTGLVVLVCGLAALSAPGGALAQGAAGTATAPDYNGWEVLASRAESVVAAARASTSALENLRGQLSSWRSTFLDAQSANTDRIATLTAQIEALGAAPSDGGDEPAQVTARRDELTAQLREAGVPGVTAGEAYSRADGLIGEIDSIIRTRATDRLFRKGPTPLDPANWPGAAGELRLMAGEIGAEVARNWTSDAQHEQRREDAATIVALFVLALLLLVRGRTWFLRAVKRLVPRGGNVYQRETRWILVSLSGFAVPMLGLVVLMLAAEATGLAGVSGQAMLATLPMMGLFLFGARWLGAVIFAEDERAPEFCNLSAENLAAGQRSATAIGVLLAAAVLLRAALAQPVFSETATLVLGFPIILGMGLVLVRTGRLLLQDARAVPTDDESGVFRDKVLYLMARTMIFVGIAGPVLAGIGYFNAGEFFVFPSVMSLTLIAFLTILQRFLSNAVALVSGADPEAGQGMSMTPVVTGAVLALLAVPAFALIWGARPTELTEMWRLLRDGFTVGDFQLSFGDLTTFALVFVLGFTMTRLLQGALRSTVLPRTKIDVGGREAIVTGAGYVGIVTALIVAVTTAGIDLSSLAIVAGALSVGIGFGLQTIVSNFVSGIILLVERPIKKGDWIEVGGVQGYVADISVRATRIETFDRSDVIVPNADLIAGRVTNYTLSNLAGRVIVPVGVAYGSDTRQIERILTEIAEAHPMVLAKPAPYVVFKSFGADALDFEIRAILRDVNWVLNVKSDMNHEIVRRFSEEGIEIPFAQRDIWLRNPEALRGVAPRPAGEGGGADGAGSPGGTRNSPAETKDDVAGVDGDAGGNV